MAADKKLRLARDRFGSHRTQLALSDAILSVPDITIFDSGRIIVQLGERLNEFKHIEGFKQFRSEVCTWAKRQAHLIVKLREILQERSITGHIATLLFLRLPQFAGTDKEFHGWVLATAQREQEGVDALVIWITEYRKTVRSGIWEVLRDCFDLGVEPGFSSFEANPIIDELETQVWRQVAYSTDEILSSNEPTSRQLWWKGFWAAKAWKTKRLHEKQLADNKVVVGIDTIIRGEDKRGVAVEDIIDLDAVLNPIVIRDLPWTDADLERELRHAGPFRANDGEVAEELLTAA